jgi:alpha-tubulin suppressor-like RCC1 family protein
MAKQTYIYISGAWRCIVNVWTGKNGQWVSETIPYVNYNGIPYECMDYGYSIVSIDGGMAHNLSLSTTGGMWVWGVNTVGQLGNNNELDVHRPIRICRNYCFNRIGAGNFHSIAIDNEGQVWAWGLSFLGQLGNNSTFPRKCTPVSIHGTKKTFCHVSGGSNHSMAIDRYGQIWSWGGGGGNNRGELGVNDTIDRCTPTSIHGIRKTFCHISGVAGSTALDKTGQVWSWGTNLSGNLGVGDVVNRCTPVSIHGVKKTFCHISSGGSHSSAIDYQGQVWSWGAGSFGRLGNDHTGNQCTPVSIHGAKKTFCHISVGRNAHTIAIDRLGQIWGWGGNTYGEVGDNSTINRCIPVSIHGQKKTFCYISTGYIHSIAVDYKGGVWTWGNVNNGRLGIGDFLLSLIPISVHGQKKTFSNIAAGDNHSFGIDYGGQLWGWGNNRYGKLGNNTLNKEITPVSVHGIKKTMCHISLGNQYTLCIDNFGQAWSWGFNYSGMLGNNTNTSKRTPVSIHGVKKTFCKIIATGASFSGTSVGIQLNGRLWCWGNNSKGQLGDNSIINRLTPISIHGTPKTFCHIAGGDRFILGIDYRGQLWGWGYNHRGQLGNNSTTSRRTPFSINGNPKTFCHISTGTTHSLGLDYQGKVWCWGNNIDGQLGDNSTTSRLTPVLISGNSKTFCKITGGLNFSAAIDYTGQIWSWGKVIGSSTSRDLGNIYTPVSIFGTKKTFCYISANVYFISAIDYKGQLWSWGNNIESQLGNDETNCKITPVKVCRI